MTRRLTALALALLVAGSPAAAHRAWLLPSATVLSADKPWITVDAASSTHLFVFEHRPMPLDGIRVTAPDGSDVKIEHGVRGELRTTFDAQLLQKGTYRVRSGGQGVFASWKAGGETKRFRGTAEALEKEVPADATELKVTESDNRVETYVTVGAPTESIFAPTGKGLEFQPVTHPNDLVAGEPARFRFLIDGKPAQDLGVEIVPGGTRYRNDQGEIELKTDAKGEITVTWPQPGWYWLRTSATDTKTSTPKASERRLGFTATFEVIAP